MKKGLVFSLMMLITSMSFAITDVTKPNALVFTDTVEASGGDNCTSEIDLSSGINTLTVSTLNTTFTGMLEVRVAHQPGGTYKYRGSSSSGSSVIADTDREAVIEVGVQGYNYAKVCGDVDVSDVEVKVLGSREVSLIKGVVDTIYINDGTDLALAKQDTLLDLLTQIGLLNEHTQPAHLDGSTRENTGVTGSLASSTTTANQLVAGVTNASRSIHVTHWDVSARLTTFADTATYFGECSLESPSGTKLATVQLMQPGNVMHSQSFSTPLIIPVNTLVRVVCTPSATTAFTFRANIVGYQKP